MNKHVSDQRKSQNHKQKELRFDFRQVRSAQGIAAAIRWWPGVGNNQLPVGRLRTCSFPARLDIRRALSTRPPTTFQMVRGTPEQTSADFTL
jgi:hypothetical protein